MPAMIPAADVVIIPKSDLLPHVDFSIDRGLATCGRSIGRLSATTGDGIDAGYDWLSAEETAPIEASL